MANSKYIPGKECNQLIRQTLKATWPDVKFSVSLGASGTSTRVRWVDGPAQSDVQAVINQFTGSDFDPMFDLQTVHASLLHGEKVLFGLNYAFAERSLSEAEAARVDTVVTSRYGPLHPYDYNLTRYRSEVSAELARMRYPSPGTSAKVVTGAS